MKTSIKNIYNCNPKISWFYLARNPNAIHLLEQNLDKINWVILSANPNAIYLLEQNVDKIYWSYLTCIKPAGGQGNKIYSVYLLICYHFELHK